MKVFLTFLALGGALVFLAAVVIGVVISNGYGRTSWLLAGVFAVDSLALVLLTARIILRGSARRNGPEH